MTEETTKTTTTAPAQEVSPERVVVREYKKKKHHTDVSGAIVLIFIGIIFLLNNFGLISWDIWGTLWKFWPIFPIIWGLQLVLGKSLLSNIIIAIVTAILLLGVLLASLIATDSRFETYFKQQLNRIEQPVQRPN